MSLARLPGDRHSAPMHRCPSSHACRDSGTEAREERNGNTRGSHLQPELTAAFCAGHSDCLQHDYDNQCPREPPQPPTEAPSNHLFDYG